MRRDLPTDAGLTLYPAQREGVRRVLEAKYRAFILAYGTGCGKTATALKAIEAMSEMPRVSPLRRVLIVCPAMVRRHWSREAARWLGVMAHPIEYGRRRKLGLKAGASRDRAYEADWQVVSYDLVGQVDPMPWSVIVFDEMHHLMTWSSHQSGLARALARANPAAFLLGLSATLIPTEVKQLWHPMMLLFGERQWGPLPRVGDCNWDFARTYCRISESAYGKQIHGANTSKLKELQRRIARVSHRVVREDIVADMPPLSVKMLDVLGTTLSHEARHGDAITRAAVTWVHDLPADMTHVVILTYHRKLARDLAGRLLADDRPVLLVDGSMTTAQRTMVLDQAERLPRALVVATSESIREGIRLMWAKKVLFAEWRQSPVMVVQVLGRFQSVGDTRRPEVEVLTDESLYGAAETLMARARDINALLRAGQAENVVQSIFKPKELTEDRLSELTAAMFAAHRPRDPNFVEEFHDDLL